jgi:RNA polymerase sigma-70 factor (ECF subfamily)
MSPDEKCDRLARLLDEHAAALALFAAQWTDAPDDCVQEALIRLTGQSAWPDNDVAWLYRVVRNQAINQARSSDRRRRHEAIAVRLRQEEAVATCGIDVHMLAMALESLDPALREIVIAKVWGKLTLEQIAEVFGGSKSNAHRRYETALAALREKLGVSCKTTKTQAAAR